MPYRLRQVNGPYFTRAEAAFGAREAMKIHPIDTLWIYQEVGGGWVYATTAMLDRKYYRLDGTVDRR